jgi:hypothetical protein
MAMSLRQIGGYLHHAQAIQALEQLETYQTARLLHLRSGDRMRAIADLQRVADGRPAPSAAQTEAQKRAEWDAEWARLRQHLGGTPARRRGLQPGDRVLIPATLE